LDKKCIPIPIAIIEHPKDVNIKPNIIGIGASKKTWKKTTNRPAELNRADITTKNKTK